jgi:hypothetical protein
MKTDIFDCARCDQDHAGLSFQALHRPVEVEPGVAAYTFTHWAPCPTTGEPILKRFPDPSGAVHWAGGMA